MDNTIQQPVAIKQSEWSWGSFMFNPIVIISSKRYKMLFWYLLAVVPLVNLFFWLVFGIYMGMKGRSIVASSAAFANDDERRGFLKGLDHAGFILFIVSVVFLALFLVFSSMSFFGILLGTRGMSSVPVGEYQQLPVQYNGTY